MSKELVEAFGITVRHLRETNGWSQEQLAEQSNLNRSYVGEIERARVIPSLVTAHKLARALNLDIVTLLTHCESIMKQKQTPLPI